MRHSDARLFKANQLLALALLTSTTAAPAHAQDTLINLTQWTVAQGGNDNWYAVLAIPCREMAAARTAKLKPRVAACSMVM